MLAVLLLTACGVQMRTRRTTTEHQKDTSSLVRNAAAAAVGLSESRTLTSQTSRKRVLRTERTEPIPERTTALGLTEESLRELPDGASYTSSAGPLTLEVRRDGDTLRIRSHSDSMSRRTTRYEEHEEHGWLQLDTLKRQYAELRRTCDSLRQVAERNTGHETQEEYRRPTRRGAWLFAGLLAGGAAGFALGRRLGRMIPFRKP